MKTFAIAALLLCAAAPIGAARASGCSVGMGGLLDFGAIVALASSGNVDSNSGASLVVRCDADVTLPPALYSGTSRDLSGPGGALPFRLSLLSPGGPDLPEAPPGAPLALPSDGADHAVVLHGRLRATDFAALPSGSYGATVTITLQY